MICLHCKTRNPVGHKFCRECGRPLAGAAEAGASLAAEEAARAEAERTQEKVALLLSEAFTLVEQGRPDEALPLAEQAAQILPSSTSAHALLASLYEQTDQNEKAIAAMETVVALNPDSVADQAKLEQLRRGVHVLPVRRRAAVPGSWPLPASRGTARALPPWLPVAAATAVGALVLGVGLALLPRTTAPPRSTAAATRNAADPRNGPVAVPSRPTLQTDAPIAAEASPVGRPDPFAPFGGAAGSAAALAQPTRRSAPGQAAPPVPRPAASALPASLLSPGGGAALTAVPPPRRFSPGGLSGGAAAARRRPAALPPAFVIADNAAAGAAAFGGGAADRGFGAGERIVARPPAAGSGAVAAAAAAASARTAPTETEGSYIRINVGPPSAAAATSPGVAAADPPAATDPLQRAQALQAQGRYREAITAYQAALGQAAASAGDIHQGIALAYQRLGEDGAARDAYRQAIGAYQAQVAAGRNTGAAQRGLASCTAALEVLGGG